MQRRGDERLLHGVLGGVEVAGPPHDRAEDLRRQVAQQVLDPRSLVHSVGVHMSGLGAPITWRTSIGCCIAAPPRPGAAEDFAAISRARACDSTSNIRWPASSSLDSGKGPSVTTGAPTPSQVTILASSGPARPWASTSSPLSVSSELSAC